MKSQLTELLTNYGEIGVYGLMAIGTRRLRKAHPIFIQGLTGNWMRSMH